MSETKPSILIVDDLAMFRVIVRDMLEELGITAVLEAASGDEALIQLKTNPVSLILSDFMMTPMNGLELLEKIRKDPALAPIPFIMISAVSEMKFAEAAVELGATSYITRPLAFDVLKERIESALGPQ